MEIKASLKNATITPRKARLIIDMVRGKSLAEASSILDSAPRKGAKIVKKVVLTAAANAVHNFGLSKDNLFIKSIEAKDGLVIKRWSPRAHGHATSILKRRSHIYISLEEVQKTTKEIQTRKSKIKTLTYEEVKKVLQEAQKASKMAKDKTIHKEKETQIGQGEKVLQKDIEPKQHFSRLGDTFKKLIHRTTKKG